MPDQAQSSGTAVYDQLLTLLRNGTFRPGDRLREEDVAKRLNLSRTPVREAIRRLEADNIVEHRPRIGAVIRQLDYSEVVQLFEMRLVLERTAAEMAAKHGADAEFDTLDTLNEQIEAERDDPLLSAAINQDFHRCLCLAARNRFLMDATRALTNSLLLLGPTTYTDPDRIDAVVRQHRAIVVALRQGDSKTAGLAAEAHLQSSLRYRLSVLSR